MRKLILILIVVAAGSVPAGAQSLKDLLYGGKLRMDSNAVLRKTDDLNSRIDPNAKQRADSLAAIAAAAIPADTVVKTTTVAADGTVNTQTTTTVAGITTTTESTTPSIAGKTNTRLWKEYTDSLIVIMNEGLQNAKKIKAQTYSLTVTYDIETTGQVTVANVLATPESDLLQAMVKQQMEAMPLQLHPMLDGNNQPRKARRTQNFTFTKH
jgi:hypothetical protein